MKKSFLLLVAILAFATIISGETQLSRLAKDDSKRQVEITVKLDSSHPILFSLTFTGKGVILDETHVLTAAHLMNNSYFYRNYKDDVRAYVQISKEGGVKKIISASVYDVDFSRDLMVFKVPEGEITGFLGEKLQPIRIAKDIYLGDPLIVLIYDQRVSDGPALLKGYVVGFFKNKEEACVGMSGAILEAFSGGTIYNLKGELAGIVVRHRPEAKSLGYAKTCYAIRDFLNKKQAKAE